MARLVPPDGIAPWQVEGARPEFGVNPRKQLADGTNVLSFYDGERTVLRIPGPFEPGAFNRLRVVVSTISRRQSVLAELVRDGKPLVRSPETWVHGAPLMLEAVLNLPGTGDFDEPFDELVLTFGEAVLFSLASIDLLQQDTLDWLPRAGEEPELVFLGRDGRQAVGLSNRHPLRGRIERPGSGRLTYSCGMPAGFRTGGRLVLRLEGGNHFEERTVALDPWSGAWQSREIPLAGFGGAPVEVSVALETDGGREALAMVGEVLVAAPKDPRNPPPTVVLVTSDTHRADHVGASRSGVPVETKFLDALAARGVWFERGWSTSNVTIPAHVAIMTGVSPRDTHVVDNRTSLGLEATTLAERFRTGGFTTFALVSTSHLADEISGLGQGFDRMSIPPSATRIAPETIGDLEPWLAEVEDKPLFVWLHLFDVHGPYVPPAPYIERYLSQFSEPRSDVDEQLAAYRGEVTFLDDELAKLFRDPRLASATLAVTADHGESLGAHDIQFNHSGLYPDTLHVPLMLWWPGAPAGHRVQRPTQQLDLGRTLLDLAGLERLEFPGRNLVANLSDPHGEAPVEPLFSIAGNGTSAAMRLGDRYLLLHLYMHMLGGEGARRTHERHTVELFDLSTDPDCEHDLAGEQPETTRKLRGLLVAWLLDEQNAGWAEAASLDSAQEAELQALGYFGASSDLLEGGWFDPHCTCEECARYE